MARASYGRLLAYLSSETRDVVGAEDALGDALVAYLRDGARQRELRAKARPRAAMFSWDRAAADTLAVYRRVA